MNSQLGLELLLWIFTAYLLSFLYRWMTAGDIPATIPWVGLRKEVFKTARASFRQVKGSLITLAEGYRKYSKHGQTYAVPDPSFQPQVMLPQEHISWLIRQPDSTLSQWAVRKERNAITYLAISDNYKDTMHLIDKIINPYLQRKLNRIQANVFDEIRASVDDTMGLDEDSWHEVNLHETLQTIIDRTGSRAFFGLPLCRNKDYLFYVRRFVLCMGAGTLIVGQLPKWFFRPFAASLINIPLRHYKAKALKYLVPLVTKRVRDFEQRASVESEDYESEDFATQTIKVLASSKDGTFNKAPEYLAEQFLSVSFAAISSTAAAGTNLLLDILSSPADIKVYQTLREEAAAVFIKQADWEDSSSLSELICIDSAIREGLRRNPLQIRGLLREVVPEKGITLPDGNHIPQGTWIGVPFQAIHMDERFYPKPEDFDPFRYARMRTDPALKAERFDSTQTSDTYLAFSYGRHSCPGRWLVSQMLKLLLAYITLNYDVNPFDKRPANTVFGDTNIPPMSARIKVRRRKHA